jgi:superfamily II DNA/RNA helicase
MCLTPNNNFNPLQVDKMLGMGYLPDIKTIFENLPSTKGREGMQVMMFTATLIPKILNLVSRYFFRDYEIYSI